MVDENLDIPIMASLAGPGSLDVSFKASLIALGSRDVPIQVSLHGISSRDVPIQASLISPIIDIGIYGTSDVDTAPRKTILFQQGGIPDRDIAPTDPYWFLKSGDTETGKEGFVEIGVGQNTSHDETDANLTGFVRVQQDDTSGEGEVKIKPSLWFYPSSEPTTPQEGMMYYDSIAQDYKFYDGVTWELIGGGAAPGVTGSGTQYTLSRWATTTSLGDSLITTDSDNTTATIGGSLVINTITAGVADYDKFLVSDTGTIKFKTGAEAYSDMDGYITSDFTTDFAAESLANLATRTHASLSDAPTDAHHTEIHVLATTGPHTDTLPLSDLAVGSQGSIIYRDVTDWAELILGTNTYVLKSGATDVAWGQVDYSELVGIQPAPVVHNLIDTTNHPVSGLTGGHFLKADTTTTYSFQVHGLGASDVGAYTTAEVDTAIDTDISTHNVTDNHIPHSGVTITAGTGLTGGGSIEAGFTIDCSITQYVDADAIAAVVAENPLTLTNALKIGGNSIEDSAGTEMIGFDGSGYIINLGTQGSPTDNDVLAWDSTASKWTVQAQTGSGGGPGTGTQWALPVWDTTTTIGDSMVSQDSGGTNLTVTGTSEFTSDITLRKAGTPVINIDAAYGLDSRIRFREYDDISAYVETALMYYDSDAAVFRVDTPAILLEGTVKTSGGYMHLYSTEATKTDWRMTFLTSNADLMAIYNYDEGLAAMGIIHIGNSTTATGLSINGFTGNAILYGPYLTIGDGSAEFTYIRQYNSSGSVYSGLANAANDHVTGSVAGDYVISCRTGNSIIISADSSYAQRHIEIDEDGDIMMDVANYLDVYPGTDSYGIIVRDVGAPSSYYVNIKNVNGVTYIGDSTGITASMVAINGTTISQATWNGSVISDTYLDDTITVTSLSVTSGPVLSSTGIDMNTDSITDCTSVTCTGNYVGAATSQYGTASTYMSSGAVMSLVANTEKAMWLSAAESDYTSSIDESGVSVNHLYYDFITNSSSILKKKNIVTLVPGVLSKDFDMLTPKEYELTHPKKNGRYIGFIAEDMPEEVIDHNPDDSVAGYNMTVLMAMMVDKIKQQDMRITELEAKLQLY